MHLEQTFAYQFQNLEIFGSKLCLVGLLKREVQMDFARNMVFFGIPSFQIVPSLNSFVLLEYIRVDLYETQKGLVIPTVVDINANFRVFSKDVTVRLC